MLSFPDIFTLDASEGAGRVMFTPLLWLTQTFLTETAVAGHWVVSKVALVLSFSLMRAVILNFSAVPFGTLAIYGVLFEIFVSKEL